MKSKRFEKISCEELVLAKSTPFPNLIGHFGPRLQSHKTSLNKRSILSNTFGGSKCLNLDNMPKDLLILDEINAMC